MQNLILTFVLLAFAGGCATTSSPPPKSQGGLLFGNYNHNHDHNEYDANNGEYINNAEPSNNVEMAPKAGAKKPRKGLLYGSGARREELAWPAQGWISSRFGPRRGRMHDGIDIAAPYGSPVRSAAGGKVVFAGYVRGYGRTVIVDHVGFRTLYAHFSRIKVRAGQRVKTGQLVGLVGNSGRSRGAHLHFEYRDSSNRPLDPMTRLRYERLVSKL